MRDITEFLLARIAEDEAAAKAATPGPWAFEWDDYGHVILAAEPHPDSVEVTDAGYDLSSRWVGATSYDDQSSTTYNSVADGDHIARHDPARVLAECEAKRQLVAFADEQFRLGADSEPYIGERVLQYLAVPYSEHPDYNEAWRP